MNTSSADILDFLNVDDHTYNQYNNHVKLEDDGWSRVMSTDEECQSFYSASTTPSSCIPGGLSQISITSTLSRSPSPEHSLLHTPPQSISAPQPLTPFAFQVSDYDDHFPSDNTYSLTSSTVDVLLQPEPTSTPQPSPRQPKHQKTPGTHPCAISPYSTAALFTRASSVSSNSSATTAPQKKSRAPPSGPISTKDFIPPDVSGLSKREARLVKNRAAAFLSRQRKREEFEGLEARVQVLETDNARLYRELESYKSGGRPVNINPTSPSTASTGALTAEIAGLKRQLASRDVELSNLHTRIRALVAASDQVGAERERMAEKDEEIRMLREQLARRSTVVKEEEESESESEVDEGVQTSSLKKDFKSAGSVAAMVLLFSLSTLLTDASKTPGAGSTTPKPPTASSTVRRPNMGHHRSDSQQRLNAFSASHFDPTSSTMFDAGNPYAFDSVPMLSGTQGLFGFDEDSLMGSSSSVAAAAPIPLPQQQVDQRDALSKAISGVKSTGLNSFEFDFTVSSSPTTTTTSKKIRVCVKSAVPLNLDLPLPLPSALALGSTLPSPVEFKPDDLDAPTSLTSSTQTGLGKRKRVMVEINPRAGGGVRRKVDEQWDVSLREEDTDFDVDFEDIVMA